MTEDQLELLALVTRCHQIVDVYAEEQDRLHATLHKAMRKEVKEHLQWLKLRIDSFNKKVAAMVKAQWPPSNHSAAIPALNPSTNNFARAATS